MKAHGVLLAGSAAARTAFFGEFDTSFAQLTQRERLEVAAGTLDLLGQTRTSHTYGGRDILLAHILPRLRDARQPGGRYYVGPGEWFEFYTDAVVELPADTEADSPTISALIDAGIVLGPRMIAVKKRAEQAEIFEELMGYWKDFLKIYPHDLFPREHIIVRNQIQRFESWFPAEVVIEAKKQKEQASST